MADITPDEIAKQIKLINVNESSAIINIKSVVLKDAFDHLKRKLCKIFNASLQQQTFSQLWKNSIVVPLPKKEIPYDASDMRPISLLPLPGEIMERIMARRLMSYLENNSILSDCQYGFRPKRSTMTSMSALLNDIYININNSKPTYTIFLDMKKAFNTVSHPILITKLEELGLSTAFTVWLSSYLSGRIQKVILNGQVSSGKPIFYGVPQGSVLGPILFSIYINNLPKICGTGIQMYADDTVLYSTDPIKLQESLGATLKWCGQNVLTINTQMDGWIKLNGWWLG